MTRRSVPVYENGFLITYRADYNQTSAIVIKFVLVVRFENRDVTMFDDLEGKTDYHFVRITQKQAYISSTFKKKKLQITIFFCVGFCYVTIRESRKSCRKKLLGELSSRQSLEKPPSYKCFGPYPDTLGGPGHTWIMTSRYPPTIVDFLQTVCGSIGI